ncbi:unnamed protein product [Caenorhabditis angaria]|uniref:Nose resistant-to-fluoxetine protein N-terminal domain-containing protein n=1 Tax=Caenorhabditis angaria TaxID=860376 RepID=A0A9P1IC63_9PELO|nr:unnamed protein product [Caenorhabditis angaria]
MNRLFIFCLILCGTSLQFENEWQNALSNAKFQNLSIQCMIDTATWLKSLELIATVSTECILTRKCTPMQEMILLQNLYAIQQLDAFGKFPTAGILEAKLIIDGSPQECERISGVKYETNYCYLALAPRATEAISPYLALRSAVCMPKSCSPQDLMNIYNSIDPILFDAKYAFCAKYDVVKDSAFWGFSIFLMVIVAISILATIADFLRESVFGLRSSESSTNIVLKILFAFSFWTNAEIVLSVKQQKEGHIKSLDCIRFMSMSWVVAGHSTLYFVSSEAVLPLLSIHKSLWNHIITNALLSVDSFLLLSGIVVSYMFFKKRPTSKTMRSPLTWIMYYVHRYLRLTPSIMIFIGFFTVYFAYIQGPQAASMGNTHLTQISGCKSDWWQNLLYINNFAAADGQTCYGISWYLALDFQLFLVAPIFIIALYISFKIGAALIAIGCIVSIAITYILYSQYKNMSADIVITDASGKFGTYLYDKPWIRGTPYLVGILTGYILSMRPIRLNWFLRIIGWMIAIAIGLACIFSNYQYDKGADWGWFAKASFYNFSRFGWSIAVSWVIIANHFGWGGPINNFMSHPIWQPFGRLSYCAYIVHWVVLFYYVNLGERPLQYYSLWQVYCYYAIPATFLSYVAAFFWSCLFEQSVAKLEKLLFSKLLLNNEKQSPKQNSWDIEDTKM